jgi:hypothetical protein
VIPWRFVPVSILRCLQDAGPFDTFRKLNNHFVTGNLQDAAGDPLTHGKFLHELIGGRRLELFHSELEPPGFRIGR